MNWTILFKKLVLGFLTGTTASIPIIPPTTIEGAFQNILIGSLSALTVAGTNYFNHRDL